MDSMILASLRGLLWAMDPGRLESMAGVLLSHAAGFRREPAEIKLVVDSRHQAQIVASDQQVDAGLVRYSRVGPVAVVPIGGVIVKRASLVNGASQPKGTSVDHVRASIGAAYRDPDVGSVLIHADSPGGSVDGVAGLSDELFSLRGGAKPIWGYADGMAASAMQWLLAQAARVYATQDATLGSIGVYRVAIDESRAAENEGVKVHLIRSSRAPLKGQGTPGVPISPEAIARWQLEVDHHTRVFDAHVMRGRGWKAEQLAVVADGQGRLAHEALAAGLIDGIGPIGAVIAEMVQRFPAGAKTTAAVSGLKDGRSPGQQETAMHGSNKGPVQSLLASVGAGPAMAGAGAIVGEGGGGGGLDIGGGTPILSLIPALGPVGADPVANGSAQPVVTVPLSTAAPVAPVATPAAPGQPMAPTIITNNAGGGGGGGGSTVAGPGLDAAAIRQQVLAAERERLTQLDAVAAGFTDVPGVADLLSSAVRNPDLDVATFRANVMDAVRKSRRPAGAAITLSVGTSGDERYASDTSLVLMGRMRTDLLHRASNGGSAEEQAACARAIRALGFDTPELYQRAVQQANSRMRRTRLLDITEAFGERALRARYGEAWQRHFDATGDHDALWIGAAFGHATGDLPNLLSNVMNKTLLSYAAETPTTYQRFCATGTFTDFRQKDYITMAELPNLILIPEGGVAPEGKMRDRKESARPATYGRKIGVTREAILADDLGGIRRTLGLWGAAARRVPEQLVYTLINSNPVRADGSTFFHANHQNLLAAAALSQPEVEKAIGIMMGLQGFGPDKAFLQIQPSFLIVPTSLWGTATRICSNPTDSTLSTPNAAVVNPIKQYGLEPIWSPYLQATSATAWYLAASPGLLPAIQVDFLNGNANPIVAPISNGSVLGQEWEVIFDCGAVMLQWEAMQKNPGA